MWTASHSRADGCHYKPVISEILSYARRFQGIMLLRLTYPMFGKTLIGLQYSVQIIPLNPNAIYKVCIIY